MVSELSASGAPVTLDHLLVLDALLQTDHIDAAAAANALQLDSRDEARAILEAMTAPALGLLGSAGVYPCGDLSSGQGVATALKGKVAYTRTRGLNPVRYAEMVREYLRDHRCITNAELRQLLGLGASASASVEGFAPARQVERPGWFLDKLPPENRPRYVLRATPEPVKQGV
jgi:ATP-dependent DNA helicase RecG